MSTLSAMGNMDMSMMQGARHAHHKPSASQLTSDVFSKLDPTGQGSIDAQSFLAALSSQTSQVQGANGAAPAVTADDASKFFSAMDGNSDGKVTQQEMTDMFQKVSDQFKTRMQMQQQASGADATTQQGVQGHHHHGHKPEGNADDMMMRAMMSVQTGGTSSASGVTSPTDAIMQALTAAQSGTASANANSATNTADQLQRQLMSMMRRYEQMSAGIATSTIASTANTSGSVSIAA